MKKTLNLLTALLCAVAFSACVDDDVKDDYVFESLQYVLESPDDGATERVINIQKGPWPNTSDKDVTITVDPYPEDYTHVTLYSDDPDAFTWKGSTELMIPAPWVEGTEAGELANEELKVPYLPGINKYESNYVKERNIEVPAHGVAEMQGQITYETVQVTYLLTLKKEMTDERKEVKGTLVYDRPTSISIATSTYIE